jgi:GNAT superfamily N-acetyltransferase
MIQIDLLADHPETIPTLAHWFRAQWPVYYGERNLTDIAQDFHLEANRDVIPVRLVAFNDRNLTGTICLREQATHKTPHHRPGLGGLYVAQAYRGRGIGAELVRAGSDAAQAMGYATVYTATDAARSIFERLGWVSVETIWHGDERLVLYRRDLAESDR